MIPVTAYQEKVYASWLGQMIGNIYGLVHENKYIDDPGPERFPYGYDYQPLPFADQLATEYLKKQKGAFSDDDTDIEYMYLRQMEKHGIEPSYAQLAEAWKYHVRGWVWVANRAALRMMNYGHYPPLTGSKQHNPHWFQIDPQLVNEVWAVTAPGMIRYACDKSRWSARITSDGVGLEPTVFYAAMYAAAFFERDIGQLIDLGIKALGPDSAFAYVAEEMKILYGKYPNDWKAARAELSRKYWVNCPAAYKSVYNAVLNGACSVLALLYGKGDFQRTLDLCCAMGFDADNQAASMCGLLGIVHGLKGIPRELLYPLAEWTEPFNDRYINRSRYDLPDASIKDMAKRTALIGEIIILAKGGERVSQSNHAYYRINPHATFRPKLELHVAPVIIFHANNYSSYTLNCSYDKERVRWEVDRGKLPPGISLHKGVLSGSPGEQGATQFEIRAGLGGRRVSQQYTVHVLGKNLARLASRILLGSKSKAVGSVSESSTKPSDDPELLRDGKTRPDFYSSYNPSHQTPFNDTFGYAWNREVTASTLVYHTGWMEQHGGWFTSFDIEYLSFGGDWISVQNLKVSPKQNLNDQMFAQAPYASYLCRFDPVQTKAIRINARPAGKSAWNHKDTVYFANISEIEVY